MQAKVACIVVVNFCYWCLASVVLSLLSYVMRTWGECFLIAAYTWFLR